MRFEFVHDGEVMASGHATGAVVGRQGIVHNDEAYGALGLDPRSPAFPASVQAWIEADRLVRA